MRLTEYPLNPNPKTSADCLNCPKKSRKGHAEANLNSLFLNLASNPNIVNTAAAASPVASGLGPR